jgi:hypothetical protein
MAGGERMDEQATSAGVGRQHLRQHQEGTAMARVYYTMETVELVRAALRATPPRLPIRRKGMSTDARVALSNHVLQMKMAGPRIPEVQSELQARGFSISVKKIRIHLHWCRAHGTAMRLADARATRPGAQPARKAWS